MVEMPDKYKDLFTERWQRNNHPDFKPRCPFPYDWTFSEFVNVYQAISKYFSIYTPYHQFKHFNNHPRTLPRLLGNSGLMQVIP